MAKASDRSAAAREKPGSAGGRVPASAVAARRHHLAPSHQGPQPTGSLRESRPGDPGSGRTTRYCIPGDPPLPNSRHAPSRVPGGFCIREEKLERGPQVAPARDPRTPTQCAPPTTPPRRSAADTCGTAAPASPLDRPGESQSPPGWRHLNVLTTRSECRRETARNLCCAEYSGP